MDKNFWKNKKVFMTGHTGFKGSWLSLWLDLLGADITGYALKPSTDPSLFELCRIDKIVDSIVADVRDGDGLKESMQRSRPEIVIHMAAQPLVRESYRDPVGTYATNVMGTVNLLEAVRACKSVKAVVNVTSDKCYENKERVKGYKESEPLGGHDPYSSSKACSEHVTGSYRNSFFNPREYELHEVGIASARAGNVIGGGDWSKDRLVPDFVRAILKGQKLIVRSPKAVRPWQHVLEPLAGYLILAEKLYKKGSKYAGAWNFGPEDRDAKTVEWIVKRLCAKWEGASFVVDKGKHPHEANYLRLDCAKAKSKLEWRPKWGLGTAIDKIIEWTLAYDDGQDTKQVCLDQIRGYMKNVKER